MKRELCGKRCKKNWILFNPTESFFSRSQIQEISLAERVTVWRHVGALNFVSILLLTIKISQSQSEKLICHCKKYVLKTKTTLRRYITFSSCHQLAFTLDKQNYVQQGKIRTIARPTSAVPSIGPSLTPDAATATISPVPSRVRLFMMARTKVILSAALARDKMRRASGHHSTNLSWTNAL